MFGLLSFFVGTRKGSERMRMRRIGVGMVAAMLLCLIGTSAQAVPKTKIEANDVIVDAGEAYNGVVFGGDSIKSRHHIALQALLDNCRATLAQKERLEVALKDNVITPAQYAAASVFHKSCEDSMDNETSALRVATTEMRTIRSALRRANTYFFIADYDAAYTKGTEAGAACFAAVAQINSALEASIISTARTILFKDYVDELLQVDTSFCCPPCPPECPCDPPCDPPEDAIWAAEAAVEALTHRVEALEQMLIASALPDEFARTIALSDDYRAGLLLDYPNSGMVETYIEDAFWAAEDEADAYVWFYTDLGDGNYYTLEALDHEIAEEWMDAETDWWDAWMGYDMAYMDADWAIMANADMKYANDVAEIEVATWIANEGVDPCCPPPCP